ncbi:MAG TPA: outer membrane beta-barrel protein [Sphingobacteriaceae bacterium]|nr:outer membrane beta-barrel protein [Sphingobacteriaceae bacterium]
MIKRLSFFILFSLISLVAAAQQRWGGGVDDETIHFGFTFQYVSAEYKIFKKASWRDPYYDSEIKEFATDSLYSISSPVSPGFGLGFVTNFRLGNNGDFRFTPALVFSDRLLDYQYKDSESFRQQKVQSTLVDLPVGFKLKSDRRKNFRAYMIGGAKYSFDIVSKKKLNDADFAPTEKLVKNTRGILWYEAGLGLDLYFEFFKLSPELKLSNSYRSVLRPENHPYSTPLDKLLLRNLQFSLYFE